MKRRAGTLLIVSLLTAWPRGAQGEDSLSLRRDAAVEVAELRVQTRASQGDSLGLALSFRYRVGRVDGEKPLFLSVTFSHDAASGQQKVAAATSLSSYRDRDGLLHAKTQLLALPRGHWREGRLFVPFFAMKLAPGPHRLTAHLAARSDAGACKAGSQPTPLPVLGASKLGLTLTKPPFQVVRLALVRAEVPPVATDIGPRRQSRPDLQWRLLIRGQPDQLLHTSATLRDRFVGEWSRPSAPVVWSEGDRLTLAVQDRDLFQHDPLGQVVLRYSQIKQLITQSIKLRSANLPLLQIALRNEAPTMPITADRAGRDRFFRGRP